MSVQQISDFTSLNGLYWSSESGHVIKQNQEDEHSIITTVTDADGKLLYEESDNSNSDYSKTYYYNNDLTVPLLFRH